MNNPRIKYFEQEDVLYLVITDEPETSVLTLKFAEEMHPTCGAGGSIKPGVERSGTPG
jgi:hypothetical protein